MNDDKREINDVFSDSLLIKILTRIIKSLRRWA